MKTSGKNHQKVYIATYLICVIQVYGASLTITQYHQCPNVSTTAILTCHIPSFTAAAQWIRNGFGMTVCQPGFCFPSSRPGGYQFSADATTMNVTISSLNITLDGTIWTCSHDSGIDIGSINLTICQPPSSSLSIVADNNRTLADGDTAVLSVSTGCITPSDSAHYNVTWKYVEANNTAEKNFDKKIMQKVSSIGGCTNTYEDNLQFNLTVTNEINTANTDLYISQVKMTFTMAGTDFIATKNVSYTLKPKVTTTTTTTTTTDCDCIIWIPVIVAVLLSAVIVIVIVSICIKCKSWALWILIIVAVLLLACVILIIVNILICTCCNSIIWILVIVAVLLFVLAVIMIICIIYKKCQRKSICVSCKEKKCECWVIWILIIVAVLLLLAGVILIIMVNIYLKYKNCFIWIIVAVLLLVLGLIMIIIVIFYIKCKKCQRRPICISCKKKKCEYCKESCGILICKCEKSFGRLICKFCKMNKCKDCKESAGIVICKCCFMKKCKDCAESARILMFKSDNLKNCDESSGILICTFCKKEDCKGCAESAGMLICKCCDSERSENPEQKLICNCCKQMKCKACSVSSEKESVGILICKCCNLKYKKNHEDGRRSASENGQYENVNKRKPDRPFGSPNRIVHKDEPNIKPVPFDPNVRRALPSHPITSGENDRNQRGLSANFEDVRGLPSDTPRSNKLPPINLQLEPTIQEEDTTVKPRKNKKKKKKNKTGDESRNVDEVA